jgi:SAM-dependent methyltransferase
MLSKIIRNIVLDSRIKDINLNRDSTELLKIHAEIIKNKIMIHSVFQEFYDLCDQLNKKYLRGSGKIIELGAGVSFIKQNYPTIITSDIKDYEGVDIVVNAQEMQFEDNSIQSFYGINCFHHFPEPRKFFKEIARTLTKGGGVILIEPYYGLFANILYKNVHEEEFYDKQQVQWETGQEANQYMTGANQALSYLIFERDKKIFEKEFPELEIVYTSVIDNYFRYLVSGGVNFKQLLPNFMEKPLKALEFILKPFSKIFALHYVIVIKKK